MNKLRIKQIKRIVTENLAAKAADCTDISQIRNEVAKFNLSNL